MTINRTVMMVQQGARRDYVYARQLEEAGLLHSLICDAAWSERTGRMLVGAANSIVSNSILGKIRRRTIKGVASNRIIASIAPNMAGLSKSFLCQELTSNVTEEILALRRRWYNFKDVKVIVNYFGNGGSLLDRAKKQGVRIVTDFISNPLHWRIVEAERARWPHWEADYRTTSDRSIYEARVERLLILSDVYLCPSQAVAEGLAHFKGFVSSRVRVVPYGYSGSNICPASALPGRVLFAASTVTVAKGLPYLANAATMLRSTGHKVDIVVAGSVAESIRKSPEVRDLTFLGSLDQKAMAREFSKADLYCLPSLAEGSATSIFEAMAHGLPIVTTASAGSVIDHGVEGFIIPERSSEEIVKAIGKIVSNRNLRTQMSLAAHTTALRFNATACGAPFIDVVRELI